MSTKPSPYHFTKEVLIELIDSLPENSRIDVSYSLPAPDGVNYLLGYNGQSTQIVHSAIDKCSLSINITYSIND